MEAQALNRFVGTSPRKMMIVIDLIRGRGVEEALSILHFSPKHAAKDAEKTLRSAISNLQSKDQAGRVDTATMYVKEVFVNGGPMAKRISPAPMGRAFRIRKRSHHLTIVVATRDVKVKAAAKPAATKVAAEKPVPKVAAEEPAPKTKKKATKATKQETPTETKES
jgi:large subunit ribosomal protein L22